MTGRRRELAEATLKLIERSSSRSKTARAVASYLVSERRTKELHGLVRDLENLQYARDGVLEVTATSAYPLSETAKRNIRQLFPEAKQVKIHEEINKSLRGGVQVRALDKVADFSVQARLRQLRNGATSPSGANNLRQGV